MVDEAARAQLDVSRETFEHLELFAELLKKWNRRINLVAPSTIPDLWTRHIHDSAQLFRLAHSTARTWADLGSGGGLPGLIIAILATSDAGGPHVTLVESDQRKAAFLRTAVRELQLRASVVCARIEDTPPLNADVVSARALAPLPDLLGFLNRHGAPGAVGIFPKGARADDEIAAALEGWTFSCEKIRSATSAESSILIVGDVRRA